MRPNVRTNERKNASRQTCAPWLVSSQNAPTQASPCDTQTSRIMPLANLSLHRNSRPPRVASPCLAEPCPTSPTWPHDAPLRPTSSHLAPPRPTLSHLAPPGPTSPHLASPRPTSSHPAQPSPTSLHPAPPCPTSPHLARKASEARPG